MAGVLYATYAGMSRVTSPPAVMGHRVLSLWNSKGLQSSIIFSSGSLTCSTVIFQVCGSVFPETLWEYFCLLILVLALLFSWPCTCKPWYWYYCKFSQEVVAGMKVTSSLHCSFWFKWPNNAYAWLLTTYLHTTYTPGHRVLQPD